MNGQKRSFNTMHFSESSSAHPNHAFLRDTLKCHCMEQAVGNHFEASFTVETASKYVKTTEMFLQLQAFADAGSVGKISSHIFQKYANQPLDYTFRNDFTDKAPGVDKDQKFWYNGRRNPATRRNVTSEGGTRISPIRSSPWRDLAFAALLVKLHQTKYRGEDQSYFDMVLQIGWVDIAGNADGEEGERFRIGEHLGLLWRQFREQTGETLTGDQFDLVVNSAIENSREAFVHALLCTRPQFDAICEAHDTSYNQKHFPSYDYNAVEVFAPGEESFPVNHDPRELDPGLVVNLSHKPSLRMYFCKYPQYESILLQAFLAAVRKRPPPVI